jgi:hypothetical protein
VRHPVVQEVIKAYERAEALLPPEEPAPRPRASAKR